MRPASAALFSPSEFYIGASTPAPALQAGERWASHRSPGFIKSGFAAVDVEAEVLVVDFLVFAVGADGINGGVELLDQFLFALAHRDAGAGPVDFLHRGDRANQLAACAFRRVEELLQHDDIVIGRIEAPVG